MNNAPAATQSVRPARMSLADRVCPVRPSVSRGGKLLILVLLLTIFEGAIRKWLVSDNPTLRYAVYFSKDVVLLLAAIAGARSVSPKYRAMVSKLLVISSTLLLLPTVINFANLNLVGAILSFRAYILIPLWGFLAAGTIRSMRDVDRIAVVVGLCTVAVAALGLLQFSLPAGHFLNRYDTGMETSHIVFQHGHARATGTFAFISGMALLSAMAAWAGAYLFLSGSNLVQRALAVATWAAGLCCATVAMSRGGTLFLLITIVVSVMLFRRVKEMLYVAAIPLLCFSLLGNDRVEDSDDPTGVYAPLVTRFERDDTIVDRVCFMVLNLRLGLTQHPLGEGFGAAQQGGQFAVSGKRHIGGAYESEWGRIGFEVGVLGWFGVLAWRFAAIRALWLAYRRANELTSRALLSASLPLVCLLAMNYMAFNHTGNSFAWTVVAVSLGGTQLIHTRTGLSQTVRRFQ